jgi:hypothetical protein
LADVASQLFRLSIAVFDRRRRTTPAAIIFLLSHFRPLFGSEFASRPRVFLLQTEHDLKSNNQQKTTILNIDTLQF